MTELHLDRAEWRAMRDAVSDHAKLMQADYSDYLLHIVFKIDLFLDLHHEEHDTKDQTVFGSERL